jgi:uncharacterized protein (UPF0548 family)
MFFVHRPSIDAVDRFVADCARLPLSYAPAGIVRDNSRARPIDDESRVIGRGTADLERAQAALRSWTHFKIGWVEVFPRHAPISVGTVVAVLIRHLGFWSLNGCRVVYEIGGGTDGRFGFAYGTLTNHAESGEELFEVFLDPETEAVIYHIRAISWPQALLARVGQPVVRLLQARFRRDSAAAMELAVSGRPGPDRETMRSGRMNRPAGIR